MVLTELLDAHGFRAAVNQLEQADGAAGLATNGKLLLQKSPSSRKKARQPSPRPMFTICAD